MVASIKLTHFSKPGKSEMTSCPMTSHSDATLSMGERYLPISGPTLDKKLTKLLGKADTGSFNLESVAN